MRRIVVKRTFQIPDMHCPSCVLRVESIQDELEGIHRIKASYHKQQLTVEYEEALVSDVEIMDSLRRLGYQPFLL